MDGETVVNGSHEPDTESKEKILKPRKPKVLSGYSKDPKYAVQNGNADPESEKSDHVRNDQDANGDLESDEKDLPNEKRSEVGEYKEEIKEKESQRNLRRSVREVTPKPDPIMKRELRKRETTPKVSTPKKQPLASKVLENQKENIKSKIEPDENLKSNENKEDSVTEELCEKEKILSDQSVILVEDSVIDTVTIDDEAEEVERPANRTSSFSSAYDDQLAENRDFQEASTSSVICLDTPSTDHSLPANKIKGRKPINAFAGFPGRTVSVKSIKRSGKRKADSPFDGSARKRFAGVTERGSEKSPGWRFFNSTWSPKSSTPFAKKWEGDSMAVNFDENTNLSLGSDSESERSSDKNQANKWCSIM